MATAFYNELFRDLFPEEWRAFMEHTFRDRGMTLMEVFSENEAELVRATNAAPSYERFCELMESKYFPLPEFWIDIELEDDEDTEHWLFQEIPVSSFFEHYEFDGDPHELWPIWQVLKTLNGDIPDRLETDPCADQCQLHALVTLACNELRRVDLGRLKRIGKREQTPLKHLALACQIMDRDTGNIWFDMDYEVYGQTNIPWTVGNVRNLKARYNEALADLDKLTELNSWLRKDMRRIREASALWRRAAVL